MGHGPGFPCFWAPGLRPCIAPPRRIFLERSPALPRSPRLPGHRCVRPAFRGPPVGPKAVLPACARLHRFVHTVPARPGPMAHPPQGLTRAAPVAPNAITSPFWELRSSEAPAPGCVLPDMWVCLFPPLNPVCLACPSFPGDTQPVVVACVLCGCPGRAGSAGRPPLAPSRAAFSPCARG